MANEKPKTGPNPDRLVIDGEWEDAVDKALNIEKPPGGWPKPEKPAKPPKKPRK